ncbi:uncharacterized protein PHACADRAFT_28864 [Phanerochaete carnosa HHB-10118-sp]|uniref:Uncharacterized protein n=1 Tax=Phanerochaete carnosa (strain HHB-10118-sp) TaxID=650164 RepID=K5V086_PHACS|nr:uncharacterized protein PHACADRAFT_28864 [Phanerochaete carnosa HHB-10118-sp]EKM55861.1 hypothetical protein PHACADRAFT_28864 [Phanerochaete carnosa HHB-10118-sp]
MKYIFFKESMDNYRIQLTTMWPPTFLFFEEFDLPAKETFQVVLYIPNMFNDDLAWGNRGDWVSTRLASPTHSPALPPPPVLEFELPIIADDEDAAWEDVPTNSLQIGSLCIYQPCWENRAEGSSPWVDLAQLEWRFEDAIHKQQRGVRLFKAVIIDLVVNVPVRTEKHPARGKFNIPLHYTYLLEEIINGASAKVSALKQLQGDMDPTVKGKLLDNTIETRLSMVGAETVTSRSNLADLIKAAMYDQSLKQKDAFVLLKMAKHASTRHESNINDLYPVVSLPFTSHLGPTISSPMVECTSEITEALGPGISWNHHDDKFNPKDFGEHNDNMEGKCAW